MLAQNLNLTDMKDFTHFVSREKQNALALANEIRMHENMFAAMEIETQSISGTADMMIRQSNKLMNIRMIGDNQLFSGTHEAIRESRIIIRRLLKNGMV